MQRLFLVFSLLAASQLHAASVQISATSSGRYFDSGFTDTSYGTGWHSGVPGEARSYFIFDLSGVNTVLGATLVLETNPAFSSYISSDPSETFALFDVSTAPATLTGGAAGAAGFNDLGTGTSYGNVVADGSTGQFVTITLNANGINYLNSALGGTAVFGGALTTLSKGATNEILFNATSGNFVRRLDLRTADSSGVPEPGTFGLIGIALLGVGMVRRRA